MNSINKWCNDQFQSALAIMVAHKADQKRAADDKSVWGQTMRLELRVTSYKQNPAEASLAGSFDECDGTIGRAKENSLVLPDPSRYVSSHHATIQYHNGAYSILDTSANGLSINDPDRQLGHGNSVNLNHGDRLFIGDYELQVHLHAARPEQPGGADIPGAPLGPEQGMPGPTATELIASLGDGAPPATGADDPFASAGELPGEHGYQALVGHEVDFDPGSHDGDYGQKSDAAVRAPVPNHVPITQEAFNAGNAIPENWDEADTLTSDTGEQAAAGAIPEDWDDPASQQRARKRKAASASSPSPKQTAGHARRRKEPAASAKAAPPKAAKPVRSPAPTPRARPSAPQAPSRPEQADRAALDLLLKGMGYSDLEVPDAAVPLVLELTGQLLRESVLGTMQALRARASIRQEMRMDLTAIRPKENNPLKFSPSLDEALTHLLAPRAKGYLPPVEAVREAFEDLKIHQVATMAGMEAAMKLVLKRFNPAVLEQRIQKNNVLDSVLPMKRKAEMWGLFTELYAEIAKEAEADFSAVFGQSFIRAYDKHVKQLQLAKKHSKPAR